METNTIITTPVVKVKRQVTNDDVKQYMPMVNKYIRDFVVKNWNEASTFKGSDEISLGNSGFAMADIRQHLMTEVVVALQNFNPNYITAEGRTVKESTFVFQHLFNRTGQLMKKLTKKRYGYGVWAQSFDELHGNNFEADV